MVQQVWLQVINMIQETLAAKCDLSEDIDPGDVRMVHNLNISGAGCSGALCKKQQVRSKHAKRKVCREGKWSLPPLGTLKINTDGSSRGNPGHAGVGGIGRDCYGEVIFFFSYYKGIQTNNYMEALAVLLALERGCALGWSKIICESDSQVVVDMLNLQQMENMDWHLAVVGRKILKLGASLDAVSFCYVP